MTSISFRTDQEKKGIHVPCPSRRKSPTDGAKWDF